MPLFTAFADAARKLGEWREHQAQLSSMMTPEEKSRMMGMWVNMGAAAGAHTLINCYKLHGVPDNAELERRWAEKNNAPAFKDGMN